MGADPGAERLRGELGDRILVEDLAHHRGPLDHLALLGAQPVQAGSQQGVDRRWDGDGREVGGGDPVPVVPLEELVVDQHRQDLLDEQRVALGGLGDPGLSYYREEGHAQEVLHQKLAVFLGEGLELDGGGIVLPPGPTGADVQQLLAGDGDHEDWGVPGPVGDVVDEVEQGGLGPLDIVEHGHHRAGPG